MSWLKWFIPPVCPFGTLKTGSGRQEEVVMLIANTIIHLYAHCKELDDEGQPVSDGNIVGNLVL